MTTNTLLAERVYQQLRADLQSAAIRPGQRITEEWAAGHYATSRTPVREACRRLAEEGLLAHEPRRGYRAAPVSAREITELYEIRRALEVLSVRRAAARGHTQSDELRELLAEWARGRLSPGEQVVYKDEAFHRTLAKLSGNEQLVDMLDSISSRIRFLRVHDFLDRGRVAATVRQHVAIVEAVIAADGDLAAALMHAHISESQTAVVKAAAAAATIQAPTTA